jgi:hypothetical protein
VDSDYYIIREKIWNSLCQTNVNTIKKRRPLVDLIAVDKETALPGIMGYGVALIEIIEGVALIIGLVLAVIYYSMDGTNYQLA